MTDSGNNTSGQDGLIGKLCCAPLSTCRSFCNEFQPHSQRLRICTRTTANLQWPIVFGTSPWFDNKSPALLIIRAVLALIFVGHFVPHMVIHWNDGYYFIYLTDWSLTLETVYLCFATYTAFAARRKLLALDGVDGPSGESAAVSLPWFVSTTWLLQHVAMPASLLVCVLYWTLDNPIWALKHAPDYFGFFVHFINFLLMTVDLQVGRNAFYLKHTLLFFLYILMFCIWSVVHHAAKVGTYGKSCGENTPKSECPIYGALDWRNPKATGILSIIIVLFIAPLCQFPLWWCVYKRNVTDDYLQNTGEKTMDVEVVIGATEESAKV